jgi:hypothetical protein
MRLIDRDSLAPLLDAEPHAPTRDRKRLLYDHLDAATNRDQLLALLRINLAEAQEMLDFLDGITGNVTAPFARNFPADTENPLLLDKVQSQAASIPPLTIHSTPPDKPNIFARGRRRSAKPRTENQEPDTE